MKALQTFNKTDNELKYSSFLLRSNTFIRNFRQLKAGTVFSYFLIKVAQ